MKDLSVGYIPLALVVAIADGGVIGRDGKLPWHIPEDLKHFKAVTTGHTMIMGRKTFESIGRPLPNRRSVVVTRSVAAIPGCDVAPDFTTALTIARTYDFEPRVIGGASIYEEALVFAAKIFLTEVHRRVEGDTFFHLDRTGWRETSRTKGESEGVEFVTLER